MSMSWTAPPTSSSSPRASPAVSPSQVSCLGQSAACSCASPTCWRHLSCFMSSLAGTHCALCSSAGVGAKAHIMEDQPPGSIGGTYGAGPIACAAASATLKVQHTVRAGQICRCLGNVCSARMSFMWQDQHLSNPCIDSAGCAGDQGRGPAVQRHVQGVSAGQGASCSLCPACRYQYKCSELCCLCRGSSSCLRGIPSSTSGAVG